MSQYVAILHNHRGYSKMWLGDRRHGVCSPKAQPLYPQQRAVVQYSKGSICLFTSEQLLPLRSSRVDHKFDCISRQCIIIWLLIANQQMLSEMHTSKTLDQNWNNTRSISLNILLVCRTCERSRNVTDPAIVCVIGHGRLSPLMCLRCRSASLKMFCLLKLWRWCQMLFRPRVRFSKAIYIIAKYCIDIIIIDLLWKVEHPSASPSSKLSLCSFL